MFSKPFHGWTEITIGNFVGRGSCIQDLPVLFLEAFLRALRWGITAEITVDEEGSSFTIRSLYATEIIVRRETEETFCFNVSVRDLAQSLLSDLQRDRQDWLEWPPEHNPRLINEREHKEFLSRRSAHLTRLISELNKYL